MPSPITKETLEHLAKLARVQLTAEEEKRLLKDLTNILGHFEELQKLDLSGVEPMAGGTTNRNVFREDDERKNTNKDAGVEAFPEKENGFLKIPPVFN